MSGAVAHAVQATALVQPDAFARTSFIVDEIDQTVMAAVGQVVKLKAGRRERNAADMRAALAELQRLFSQASQMAGVTSRVLPQEGQ